MREELSARGGLAYDLLSKAERERDYPAVKKLGRVIEADTRFVVVDPHLRTLLDGGRQVGFRELLEGSVQLWARRIENLGLDPAPGRQEIYIWRDDYDPTFLGYMAGVLRLENFLESGGAII